MHPPHLHPDRCSIQRSWYGNQPHGNALDLNSTVFYLCNLGLEESLYKTGMCSGYQDTRSLRCILNFKNVNFYPLSWLEGLTLYLFVLCKYCVCLTKVDADILPITL